MSWFTWHSFIMTRNLMFFKVVRLNSCLIIFTWIFDNVMKLWLKSRDGWLAMATSWYQVDITALTWHQLVIKIMPLYWLVPVTVATHWCQVDAKVPMCEHVAIVTLWMKSPEHVINLDHCLTCTSDRHWNAIQSQRYVALRLRFEWWYNWTWNNMTSNTSDIVLQPVKHWYVFYSLDHNNQT
jgi:hypothetical protein